MLFTIKTIAIAEFKSLLKQKTFALLLIIFLAMALFSTYIGWSTSNTIAGVYNETVKQMVTNGVKEIPTNPFLANPPLYILKNMAVYVFLIGSLLAIIVGYSAFIRERRAGVSKIIFSRPLGKLDFVLGKMAGIILTLSLIIGASFIISLLSTSIIYGHGLSASDTENLLIFYFFSLLYILVFAYLGLFFAIRSKSESLALLAPIVIWIFISFVMPQMTSALDPTAILNPTNLQTSAFQNNFFSVMQHIIRSLSISEDYKIISRSLLQGDMKEYPIWSTFAYLSVAIGMSLHIIKKYDVSEAEIEE
jgi:ABC-type transport system involved in multi-copper enzyme maturation permease subunit